ncbi:MAG: 2-amino-4-hydroxy-6-hydroxymethyldihydropteridine diphosphokinase [Actinomycetota bacterium]|nr:2-amino-4-hydroxy-6-hydroxymethyldihydropteridine diphosphokinase [Actinomycetota bacterium]
MRITAGPGNGASGGGSPYSTAVLSLGSNLGDRLGHLRSAVAGLGDYVAGPRAVSAVYETKPWGGVEQPAYLNAVVIVTGERSPAQWLEVAHVLEQAAGRRREVHWGARTLDVDIVVVGRIRSDDPVLTLPHPHAHERAFVLVPWLDADPDAALPGHGRVADLLSTMDTSGVVRWGRLELPG